MKGEKDKINIDFKKKAKTIGISFAGIGTVLEVLSSGLDVVDLFIPKEKTKTIETSLGEVKTSDIVKILWKTNM